MARRTASLDSKKEHSSVVMSMGPGASFLGVGRGGRDGVQVSKPSNEGLERPSFIVSVLA